MSQVLEAIATAPQERAQDNRATFLRLIGEFGRFRSQVALTLFLVLVTASANAVGPWLVGRAIDRDILGHDPVGLARSMGLLALVFIAQALASRKQIAQVGAIGQQVLASLRARLFARFMRLPLGYFDRRAVGDLMSRVLNDVETLNGVLSQGLIQLLGSLFGLIGILIAMLYLNPLLAIISFSVIPLIVLLTALFARRAREAFRATRETTGGVTAGLQEEIVGVREAQAFNRTETNIAQFRQQNAANRDANVSAVAISSAFPPALDVLNTLATAIVIGVGGYLVSREALTVGLLASFLIYVQQFFRPIQLLSQFYTQLQSALAGAERIFAILDERVEPVDAPAAAPLPDISGRVEFDRVSFAYDPARPVLHEVSFVAEPGQMVALVGPTGAGKTTIVSLVPRLYDVAAGAVRVDGYDVRQVTRDSLRSRMAMVLQEPFLFGGTVAENIGYGRLDATREEIEAAARVVNAHEFIGGLPEGYDTRIGEGGGSLSQGQRQLVAFARAVLADPRILILDEATANVDTRTETLIQRALAVLLRGRTSLVIAHRLSTIRNADQILVVDDGRIVERGTHDSLLNAGGLYADLYRRQFGSAPVPAA